MSKGNTVRLLMLPFGFGTMLCGEAMARESFAAWVVGMIIAIAAGTFISATVGWGNE